MQAQAQEQATRKRPAPAAQEAPKRPKWAPANRPTLSEMLARKASSEPRLSSSQTSEDDVPLSRVAQRVQHKQPALKTAPVKQSGKQRAKTQGVEKTTENGETVFQLSAKRRLTLRKWKDAVLVDLREFYDANGVAKPGKKGISLSLDQWLKLAELPDAVAEAIECVEDDRIQDETLADVSGRILRPDGDLRSIAFPLSTKRRLTVRFFKGVLIDIREFYDQDGAMKPGKKGIALSKDQWTALQEVAAEVTELAERL